MRAEKQSLTKDYRARLDESPFFLLVDYRGLKVGHFNELRARLRKVGAEVHVVKNSVFRIAAQEAGLADLMGLLAGQLAAVTGQRDICATAKVLKTFQAEFSKPRIRLGFLGRRQLEAAEVLVLAELPPLKALRSKTLGVLQASAAQFVRLLSTPGGQLARVLQARVEREKVE